MLVLHLILLLVHLFGSSTANKELFVDDIWFKVYFLLIKETSPCIIIFRKIIFFHENLVGQIKTIFIANLSHKSFKAALLKVKQIDLSNI